MAKAKDLVIVESPAKAKTIEKYLGSGYKVTASMGHLRDLPKSKMGVDIEHGFEPQYIPVRDKKELINELKKEAKEAKTVYLATDPDREGEAISWHLKELLGLDDEKAKRVTFNEITKKVVTESIKNPRSIDQNLVDSQQARRILDRIVGYELSPLLWRKIKKGLSAGRVQSVATRMVVDREEEIEAFQSQEYWLLDARLNCGAEDAVFTARFHGKGDKKQELRSKDEVDEVINAVQAQPFTVSGVKRGEKQKSPAPPFITSTLQQEASRRLSMTPRRTMSIAQQLYEGVEISGHGSIGLITYMRTDSLRLSEEALAAAKDFIIGHYGPEYYPGSPRHFKTKAGAQDAHEAIRPTDVNLTPELVRKDLTQEQYRLYRLIWGRFTACQMANAKYDNVAVEVSSAGYTFRATYSEMKFKGFTAVYEEAKDEESSELANPLPSLSEGQALTLEKLIPEQQFTQPPARFTEATLIRAMEEKGIGRPSTYAPTISTITSHDYVIKEGKYLKPTPLGRVVTGLMKEHFADIVDLKFTNQMEEELDGIENGKAQWRDVLADFYGDFSKEMDEAEKAMDGVKLKVPDVLSDEYCDVCGRQMVVKKGRFGYFLACPGFPDCTFTKPIVVEMPGKCPKCGGRILKRTSKKGYVFYACERGTDCGFITWDVPTKDFCPACGKTMFKHSGRGPLKSFCINEQCPNFVPEDKRTFKKKTPEEKAQAAAEKAAKAAEKAAAAEGEEETKPARKTAAKKTTAAKTTAKKTAAKTTAKKTTAKKTTAAKKTSTKKSADTEE
ncbi:MAG: type I DNA topoisomerase [Candidatus Limivicinus sp.]|nr:type I DNA topoisomerase [Candidatus Limivicinus sp.]